MLATIDCRLEGDHPELPLVDVSSFDGILRFNNARIAFERRLTELGEASQKQFEPVVRWMRCFIQEFAPELLTEF